MKFKITVILKNEIPNQPPFGFVFFYDNVTRKTKPAGTYDSLVEIEEWQLSQDRDVEPTHDFRYLFPTGVRVGEWRNKCSILLRDKKTGHRVWLDQNCASFTIEDVADDFQYVMENDSPIMLPISPKYTDAARERIKLWSDEYKQ